MSVHYNVEYFKDGEIRRFLDDFRKNVSQAPDAAAIEDSERVLTRKELDEASDKIAELLAEMGTLVGEPVLILLPRSCYYICALLGVHKAGAALVCLDTGYPPERIETIREDSGSRFVIDSAFVEKALKRPLGAEKISPAVSGGSPAFIIYTSGSTGKPKGILHDRESLERGCRRVIDTAECSAASDMRWCSIIPFTFVAVTLDIIMPLALGWRIYIASDEIRKDIALIRNIINSKKISAIYLPPQLLKNFGALPKSLSLVFTGSEKLTNFAPPEGIKVISLYGLSETFPGVAAFETDRFREIVPIGQTVGCKAIIIGGDGRPAARGAEGEICLAGHFARCYINNPEATAQTFTQNPQADGPEDAELLHTGDNGYIDEEGNIIYVNRRDWMIKINGQRVEPGEVESVISKIPGVTQAVANAFATAADSMMIAVFYTAAADTDEEHIRAAAREKLPSYMMPSLFVRLDKFPLNANGKLDRKSLLLPSEDETLSPDDLPCGEAEERICAAFCKILERKTVGRNSDFFRLGGDSISAIRLTAALEEEGLEIPTAMLRLNATPSALAAALQSAEGDSGLPAVSEPDSDSPFEMTDESKMMARLDKEAEAECPYKPFSMKYEIKGEIDAEKLDAALERLRNENDIFSLKCADDGERYIPCGIGEGDFTIDHEEERGHFLCVTAPHLMYDRFYVEMLLKNLADIYNGKEPEHFDSMRAVSSWFEAAKQSRLFIEAGAYWKKTAEMAKSFKPVTVPDVPDKKWRFISAGAETPAKWLDELCSLYGATRYEILYAAFHKMLAREYGDTVITGTASNLRTLAPLKQAAGCLAYRTFVMTENSRAPFGKLAGEIKESVAKSQLYALTAPRTVIDPECTDYPIYMFNYWSEGAGTKATLFGEAALGECAIVGEEYATIPMVLHISDQKEKISVGALARGGLFSEAALSEICADYIKTLEIIKNSR